MGVFGVGMGVGCGCVWGCVCVAMWSNHLVSDGETRGYGIAWGTCMLSGGNE